MNPSLSRRRFLQLGAQGAAAGLVCGVGVSIAERSPTGADTHPAATARAAIFILLDGGVSHIDSFDAKAGSWTPAAFGIGPAGATSLPHALFPNLVAHADRVAVVRSYTAWDDSHLGAQYALQTGQRLDPSRFAVVPSFGSIVAYDTWSARAVGDYLPPFVALNADASHAGLVGAGALPALARPVRLADDHDAIAAVWRGDARVTGTLAVTPERRTHYGATALGEALARAANLIAAAAGTRLVLVGSGGWDFHTDIYATGDRSYADRCRHLDTALAALIVELAALPSPRGSLLDDTLVVCASEMGRTPGAPNAAGGRGHYPGVGSVAMAGGGVKGGRAIGATDPTGAVITDPGWSAGRPVTAADLSASMQSALGLDWTGDLRLPGGTTLPRFEATLTPHAQPIRELFT